MSSTDSSNEPEWLTTAEVASLLRVPVRTIYAWRAHGDDAPVAARIGKHLRWRRRDIEAWLTSHSDRRA